MTAKNFTVDTGITITGASGNIALPGNTGVIESYANNISIYSDADQLNGALFYDTGSEIYAVQDFAIFTDNANTSHIWRFYANATMTAPGDIVSQGNITAVGNIVAGNLLTSGVITTPGATTTLYIDPTNQGVGYVQIPTFTDGGESLAIVNQYPSSDGIYVVTETGTFNFRGNGLIFPDSTTQSTAYTGPTIANTIANGNSNVVISTAAGNINFNVNGGAYGMLSANSVAIGQYAGYTVQGTDAVAIGTYAGNTSQGGSSVAVGSSSGKSAQGVNSVAVGTGAAEQHQGASSTALGFTAGQISQGGFAVAVGSGAGGRAQGDGAIAIGADAASANQGAYAIAIGALSANAAQANNSIIIDATSTSVNATESGFYVAPVRNDTGNIGNVVTYNTTTKELTYTNTISVAGNITGGNIIATNIGNIASLNINGNASTILYGNGVFGAITAGTSLINGNSNVVVTTNANVLIGTAGNANVMDIGLDSRVRLGGLKVIGGNINAGEGYVQFGASTLSMFAGNIQLLAGGYIKGPAGVNVIQLNSPESGSARIIGNLAVGSSNTGNIFGGNLSVSGNITGNTAGYTIGYLDIPQVTFSANATAALTDAGKHYYSTTAGNLALTLPDNSNVAFPTGATLTVVVNAAGNVIVAQGTGVTLYMAGSSTTGNRTVGAYGLASVMKVAANTWVISGTGVY